MYILDGALGTELEKVVSKQSMGDLWSGKVLVENPHLIKDIYKNYINHGSNLITTATYQILYDGLKKQQFNHEQILSLWDKSIDVAKQAIQETGQSCGIIGSIGPYGSYINDGSEYTGHYPPPITEEELITHHQPLIEYMNKKSPEDIQLIGFETVPNLIELRAILSACRNTEKPYYISFCMNPELTAQTIVDTINKYQPANLVAIGLNCINYQDVSEYLHQFSLLQNRYPYVLYPNYGYIVNAAGEANVATVSPASWAEAARGWIQFNLFGIGGCCNTTANEIAIIRKMTTKRRS